MMTEDLSENIKKKRRREGRKILNNSRERERTGHFFRECDRLTETIFNCVERFNVVVDLRVA